MSLLILNAEQLRQFADAAESRRGGDPYWITYRDQDEPGVWQGADAPPDAVFGVQTKVVEDRPKLASMIVDCGGHTRDLVEQYDAVFWSEAAVEKFILPYYASKSMWEAAAVLDKLSYYWYGTIPGEDGDDGDDPLVPYAIAHTPDSDWNTVAVDGIGPQLHFLVRDEDGVRAVRLSDLADPPPRAERVDPAGRTRVATAAA
jgi:hypothetical protein